MVACGPGPDEEELLREAATALGASLGNIVPEADGTGFKIALDATEYVISGALTIPAKVTVEVGSGTTLDFNANQATLAGGGRVVVKDGGIIKSWDGTGATLWASGAPSIVLEAGATGYLNGSGTAYVGDDAGATIELETGFITLKKQSNVLEGDAVVHGVFPVRAGHIITIKSGTMVVENGATLDISGALRWSAGNPDTGSYLHGAIHVYGTLNDKDPGDTLWVNPGSDGEIVFHAGSQGYLDGTVSPSFERIDITGDATLTLKNPQGSVVYVVANNDSGNVSLDGHTLDEGNYSSAYEKL
jgi:hypothetical protein